MQLSPWKHVRLRRHYLATALAYLQVSRWLASNGSTCHSIILLLNIFEISKKHIWLEFTQTGPVEMYGKIKVFMKERYFLQTALLSLFLGNFLHGLLFDSEDGGSTSYETL
jgi:hypothetical protein